MNDFWLSCGHHFLDRDESGGYVVTDEFLKVYLARPELVPPPDACSVERNLHHSLLSNPRRPVGAAEIAAIADIDARENWEILVGFRDRLLNRKTLEACYVDLIRSGVDKTPPLFINQLVHAILRNALESAKQKSECVETFERVKEHLTANNLDLQATRLQFGAQLTVDPANESFTGSMSDKAARPSIAMRVMMALRGLNTRKRRKKRAER